MKRQMLYVQEMTLHNSKGKGNQLKYNKAK